MRSSIADQSLFIIRSRADTASPILAGPSRRTIAPFGFGHGCTSG